MATQYAFFKYHPNSVILTSKEATTCRQQSLTLMVMLTHCHLQIRLTAQ